MIINLNKLFLLKKKQHFEPSSLISVNNNASLIFSFYYYMFLFMRTNLNDSAYI